MSGLRVYLFGKLRIERGDQVLAGIHARRVQELLVYLLLFQDHPHTRERLADVLWGEGTSMQVRKGLRQALWKLQSVLGTACGPSATCLLRVDPEYIEINAATDVWVDATVFAAAYSRAQGVPGAALDHACACALREAAALYSGDLLTGWCQEWCLFERQRFEHMYLEILDKLMCHAEVQGNYEVGAEYGTRILRYDRARERTHRAMMRLYYLAGDRVEALRQYDRCVAALAEEIGVVPARTTTDLAETMRTDAFGQAGTLGRYPLVVDTSDREALGVAVSFAGRTNGYADPRVASVSSELPEVDVTRLLASMKQVQGLLAELDDRVRKIIDVIEPNQER